MIADSDEDADLELADIPVTGVVDTGEATLLTLLRHAEIPATGMPPIGLIEDDTDLPTLTMPIRTVGAIKTTREDITLLLVVRPVTLALGC